MNAPFSIPLPTLPEVHRFLLATLQHSCHVEFFLDMFKVGGEDPQRPHDLVGENNKYDWPVLSRIALQYRDNSETWFKNMVLPGIILHRKQYHHIAFDREVPIFDEKAMDGNIVGAIDAICSLREPDRVYQGGRHTYEELITKFQSEKSLRKRFWFAEACEFMSKSEQPDLESIKTLRDFPNIGIPAPIYDAITARVDETIQMLSAKGYELITPASKKREHAAAYN